MTQVWDELAKETGGEHDPPGSLPALLHSTLRRRVLGWSARLPQGAEVLDLGCGKGRLARLLAEARPDLAVTGMDFSEAMLDAARAESPDKTNPAWILGDARHWPLAADRMDAVLAMDLLAHLAPGAEVDLFFSEARRVCKGCLLLEIKNPWSLRLILALRRLLDRLPARGAREFLLGIKSHAAGIPIHVHDPKVLLKDYALEGRLRPWPFFPCPSQVYVLRLGQKNPDQDGLP
jgi:SAM-dependent methyltransferase